MPDLWWRAVYDDGSVLEEVDGVSSEAIDRDRLRRFELRAGAVDVVALDFADPSQQRLVFRRRGAISNGVAEPEVCLVGWNTATGVRVVALSPFLHEQVDLPRVFPAHLEATARQFAEAVRCPVAEVVGGWLVDHDIDLLPCEAL